MTEYQAEVIIGKLREAESLVLSLESDNKSGALHEAKTHIWKAMEKVAEATDE